MFSRTLTISLVFGSANLISSTMIFLRRNLSRKYGLKGKSLYLLRSCISVVPWHGAKTIPPPTCVKSASVLWRRLLSEIRLTLTSLLVLADWVSL